MPVWEATSVDHVELSALDSIWYPVIALPPLSEGASQSTSIAVLPSAAAVGFWGWPGAVLLFVVAEATALAGPVPTALMAETR